MTVEPTDGARLGAPGAGRRAGPDGRGRLRRGDRWRRGDRRGHGPGRRHPRAERRAGRGDRLRRRDLQPLQQTHPRRPALPRAAQLRPGPRGPPGAEPALDRARPPPRPAGVVPLYPLQHKYWERFYVGTGVLLYDIMGEARALLPVPPRPATRTRCTTPTSTTFQTPTNPAARRPGASVTEHRRDTPAPRDLTRGQYVDGAALDERGRCRPLEQVLQSAALVTDRDATPIGARAGRMLGGE